MAGYIRTDRAILAGGETRFDSGWRAVRETAARFARGVGGMRRLRHLRPRPRLAHRVGSPAASHVFRGAVFEGIVIHERGVVLDANSAVLDLLGCQRSDLLRRSLYDFIAPETRELFDEQTARADQQPFPAVLVRADGTRCPVELRCKPLRYRGRAVRSTAVREVAPRPQTAVGIDIDENLYRQMFEGHQAIKLLIDARDGQIIDANPAATEFYGYSRETLLTLHISDINCLPPDNLSAAMARAADEKQTRFEFQHRLASGEVRDVEVVSSPVILKDRQLLYSIVTDITDRKRAEIEREQLIQDLDMFAHAVAHDLKNPLNLVLAYAMLLDEDADRLTRAVREEYVHEILSGTKKASTIIDELLLLAQLRRGDLVVAPLDMPSIVAEARARLSHMTTGSRATISMTDGWPSAVGYGPWIEEVWVNYLSNALKYGGEAPHVTVGATPLPEGMVRFWVRDDGPGLNAEQQAQLFVSFDQIRHPSTKGYGLGLAIVRHIVEKLGGRVGVESTPGQGCLFYFDLPAVPPTDATPPVA